MNQLLVICQQCRIIKKTKFLLDKYPVMEQGIA
jgi:hypothetical protein